MIPTQVHTITLAQTHIPTYIFIYTWIHIHIPDTLTYKNTILNVDGRG